MAICPCTFCRAPLSPALPPILSGPPQPVLPKHPHMHYCCMALDNMAACAPVENMRRLFRLRLLHEVRAVNCAEDRTAARHVTTTRRRAHLSDTSAASLATCGCGWEYSCSTSGTTPSFSSAGSVRNAAPSSRRHSRMARVPWR